MPHNIPKERGSQVPFRRTVLRISSQKSADHMQCPVCTDVCKYNIQYVNGKSNYMCNKNITIEQCSNMYSVGVSSEADFIILCVAFIVHHVRVSSVKSRNLQANMFKFLWPKETEQIKRKCRKFLFF